MVRASRPILFLATCALTAGCLDRYDPPPELESINIEQGLFDPAGAPLTLTFTEAVQLTTLTVTLYLARTDEELNLCIPTASDTLPMGCTEAARAVLGPCTASAGNAIRGDASETATRYECEGGELSVDETSRAVSLVPTSRLVPFERYIVRVEEGLADRAGRKRGVPLETIFQVKSNIPCGPTDFPSGFFFTVFDIEQPIAAQFHFAFWLQVDPATGKTRLFGADIDPKDEVATDPKVDRDFNNWFVDAFPPTGATIVADGQIATVEGDQVLVVFPFSLLVAVPRVEAPGAELNARILQMQDVGAPGAPREALVGRLNSPTVFLGEGADRAELGAGRGGASLFRLTDAEAPTIEDLLPKGVTLADVTAPFEACELRPDFGDLSAQFERAVCARRHRSVDRTIL